MLKSLSVFAVCLITLCFVLTSSVLQAEDKAKSYYLIGNSLTWDTAPSLLDGDVQWHVDCGKSLPYIMAHPEMPCVKTSTLWPQALKENAGRRSRHDFQMGGYAAQCDLYHSYRLGTK